MVFAENKLTENKLTVNLRKAYYEALILMEVDSTTIY